MRERIQQRLDDLELSPRAASIKAGLSTHFLQNLFANEDKGINTASLIKLAEALEVTPEWLLTGRGEKTVTPEVLSFMDAFANKLDEEGRKTVMDMLEFEVVRSEARNAADKNKT